MLLVLSVTGVLVTASAFSYDAQGFVGDIRPVWSDDQMAQCSGNFGRPNMVATPSGIIVVGDCCAEDACNNNGKEDAVVAPDDYSQGAYLVMTRTQDLGKTWHHFQNLTDTHGTMNGAAIVYDPDTKKTILWAQHIPGGNSKQSFHVKYYVRTSDDDGISWSPLHDVTNQVAHCSPEKNMLLKSAGNSVVNNGRIVLPMNDHSNHGRIFYSDDGGATWNCSNLFPSLEVSVAAVPGTHTTLYMNGRPLNGYAPHRTDYWSHDNGATWTQGQKSQLQSPQGGPCERSLVEDGAYLVSGAPTGYHRTNMQVACSKDGGHTWPSTLSVNHGPGGYSTLAAVDGGVFMVWQDQKAHAGEPHNFVCAQISDGWC